jgi:hypothetical protein
MNREMALAEWRRAVESLSAADLLAREGYEADAISRAYYAVVHAAKAALQARDVAAESHAAVRRLFGLHLVRSGEIEPEWSAQIAESLDDRLAADYDVEASFSNADAKEECRNAHRFLVRVRRHLRENGLTARELGRLPRSP